MANASANSRLEHNLSNCGDRSIQTSALPISRAQAGLAAANLLRCPQRVQSSLPFRMGKMATNSTMPDFRQPNAIERAFNRFFGVLVGLGLGMKHNYLLQVRGRKSGKLYSTPIDLLEIGGKRFLVAPRGRTQWVRNAEAAGEVTLKRGSFKQSFRLRAIPDSEKGQYLKAYLDSFKTTVQRYFSVPAGSEAQAFASIAANYPVFELIEK